MKNTVKFIHKNSCIVADGGCSGLETSNTMAAYLASALRTYEAVKCDLYITRDNEFVTCSDSHKDFSVKQIQKNNLSDLQNIVFYDMGTEKHRYDLRIVPFRDYLETCVNYGKTVVIDIHDYLIRGMIKYLINIINSYNYMDKTVFVSQHYGVLNCIKLFSQDYKCRYKTSKWEENAIDRISRHGIDICVDQTLLDEEKVKYLKSKNLVVDCFGVNNPQRATELDTYGVDYITTNILE